MYFDFSISPSLNVRSSFITANSLLVGRWWKRAKFWTVKYKPLIGVKHFFIFQKRNTKERVHTRLICSRMRTMSCSRVEIFWISCDRLSSNETRNSAKEATTQLYTNSTKADNSGLVLVIINPHRPSSPLASSAHDTSDFVLLNSEKNKRPLQIYKPISNTSHFGHYTVQSGR